MSCYTLFKGLLLLSQPAGFIALLVRKRAPFFDSVTFPLVLKYVSSKDWDTPSAIAFNIRLTRRGLETGFFTKIFRYN
jgi:hypothetical protein